MPSPAEVAREHARDRLGLVETISAEAAKAWRKVDPARIVDSWLKLMGPLLVLLTGTQQVAAAEADAYLDEVLDVQGIDPAAVGELAPEALSGVASDGRTLEGLLAYPAFAVLDLVRSGTGVDESLASGGFVLDTIARTQVADAGRAADLIATAARRQATGYVRMLVGGSCSRCAILAGRRYAWNAGFNRHPRC